MALNKIHVRKKDTVMVISGKDKGKTGEVLLVNPTAGRVTIEGVNIVSKHKKPSKANTQGGIIKEAAPINSSKVMLFCKKCNSVTRISSKILSDGTKVRVCKKCAETF